MNKTIIVIISALLITSLFSCKKDTTINKKASLVVYPNPFINTFYAIIQLDKPQAFTCKVYNADGVVIKELSNNGMQLKNNIVVNPTNEKDGLMYVVIELPNETLSAKIIKVKP
jgi:hypothetical protein